MYVWAGVKAHITKFSSGGLKCHTSIVIPVAQIVRIVALARTVARFTAVIHIEPI